MINGEYIDPTLAMEFITEDIELRHVRVLHYGKWSQDIQDLFVLNCFINGSNVPHEGVVIKHESGHRQKVAKVINPDYLIYSEKHNIGDSH